MTYYAVITILDKTLFQPGDELPWAEDDPRAVEYLRRGSITDRKPHHDPSVRRRGKTTKGQS